MKKLNYLAVLFTVTGVFVASNIYTFIPIYGPIAHSLLISEKQAVIAGSLFTFFYAFGLLCFGSASHLFGNRNILVWGMFTASIATLAVGLSQDIIFLCLARSLQGFTLASFAPIAFAYTFDLYHGNKRTLLLVFINTGYLVAGILGQVVSSYLGQVYGWRNVFFFFTIFYFIFFIISYYFLPNTNHQKSEKSTVIIFYQLLKDINLLKSYIITFSLLFSSVAFYETLERYFDNPQSLRIVGLTGAVLSLFTGKLVERWKVSGTLFIGILLGMSSFLLILKLQAGWVYFITIIFISSISILIPTIVSRIGSISGEHRVLALSLYSFILLIGASLAPTLVIYLSFHQVFFTLLSLYFLNLFMVKIK